MTKVVHHPHQGTLLFPHEHLLIWAKQRPNAIYLKQMVDRQIKSYSFARVADQARRLANGLLKVGLVPGDKVAIISKNCAEWFISDLALMMAGLVSVPVFPSAGEETILSSLKHSECRIALVGKLDDPTACMEALKHLPEIISIGFSYSQVPECQLNFDDLIRESPPLREPVKQTDDSVMSIIYTSGTSGTPKGAMISFGAYSWVVNQITNMICVNQRDRLFSYLPLAHVTERVYIFGLSITCGVCVAFPESPDTFIDDLKRQRPTLFLSVPRLWALFQQRILDTLPPKRLSLLLRLPVINHIVKHKIARQLGLDKSRILGCGSAAIAPDILRWYEALDLPISEAWGMTESVAFSAINYPYNSEKVGAVGKAAPGVQIKLDDSGEVLVQTKGTFSGYYKNDLATRQAFTHDGWLKTGDIGTIDDEGYLTLLGQIQDNFKTAKGKLVIPVPIEHKLASLIQTDMLCLIGSGLPAPMLIIVVPRFEDVDKSHYEASIYKAISTVNSQLPSHEQIRAVLVSNTPWTIQNGLLTPTLKIRRHKLEQKYHQLGQQWPEEHLIQWE